MFYKLRRESEAEKLEHEAKEAVFDRDMASARRAQEEEVRQWNRKFEALQATVDSVSDTERLRAVQREKTELEIKVSSLLSEVDELRYLATYPVLKRNEIQSCLNRANVSISGN